MQEQLSDCFQLPLVELQAADTDHETYIFSTMVHVGGWMVSAVPLHTFFPLIQLNHFVSGFAGEGLQLSRILKISFNPPRIEHL